MKTAAELNLEKALAECKQLRAERDEAIKARDNWRLKHKLACMVARNLCDELNALRAERGAENAPLPAPEKIF
jgi:hypothetical protein